MRRPFPSQLVPFLLSLFLLATLACAPGSTPVGGELGDHVAAAIASGTGVFDHGELDELLAGGVRDGLVDYEHFAAQRNRLDAYLGRVATVDLANLEGQQLKALLINAYNALTIQSILDHPGITSIREIPGVWKERSHRFGGFEVTLDNLEHNLLRPYFHDPRIHMAVNCASMSCAPLPPWAFAGERLDSQLDEWTRAFFRNPEYTRVDNGTLVLSMLLDWYGDDFVQESSSPRAESLAGFVRSYTSEDIAVFIDEHGGAPPIQFSEYDWSLNQAPTT